MERFIFNQLIVDSGKDNQGRPILAVYCSHFPDPETTDYDELLEYFKHKNYAMLLLIHRLSLKRLNRIVANEYILVVFTEPMDNSPSIGWMYNAYKTLSRDYKKNIKEMIVVHPSWWFRLIIGFMQNIVSSKFAKKIRNVGSIEELEDLISTVAMMIPADVRIYDREENENEDFEEEELENAKDIMEGGKKGKIFKKSLKDYEGEDYPEEIKALIEYITNKGLKSDSIFRRSPNQEALLIIKTEMDAHNPLNFDDYDIYTLASVLKDYVRGLPETLIPESSYAILQSEDIKISTMPLEELIPFIQKSFLKPLDPKSLKLLKDLMMLSAMTAQLKHVNRMSFKALAVVWAPNMIQKESKADELRIIPAVIRVIECMIENYDEVFCRKY